MTKKLKFDDYTVSYKDTPEIRDKVFEEVLKYFREFEAFSGECIFQMDDPQIEAPQYFANIAEKILKFKINDK